MFCPKCGAKFEEQGPCPYCGTSFMIDKLSDGDENQANVSVNERIVYNGKYENILLFAILSITVGLLTGIFGLAMAIMAINKSEYVYKENGYFSPQVKAGRIIATISLVLNIIVIIAFVFAYFYVKNYGYEALFDSYFSSCVSAGVR